MKNKYYLIVLTITFLSCSSELPPNRYRAWMAQNSADLSSTVDQGATTVGLTYLPAAWLALQEAGNAPVDSIAKVLSEYVGLEYYRLRVGMKNNAGDILQYAAGSTDVYYQRVEYFSFGLQRDLHLLLGRDTLPCKLFHFERNYGAAPYMDFMLGFETPPTSNADRMLLYNDRVYSNTTLQLNIPFKHIQRIPNLKL